MTTLLFVFGGTVKIISSVGRCVRSDDASLDLKVQPLPVPVLDGRITQPRFGVPVLNDSISLVTSKIAGAPSTTGVNEKVAVLAASTLSALTPPPRLSHVAVSVQSMIILCRRNRSLDSYVEPDTFVGVNNMSLADWMMAFVGTRPALVPKMESNRTRPCPIWFPVAVEVSRSTTIFSLVP